MVEIDYYFRSSSPFTYLGNAKFHEIALKHGATIHYKPTELSIVWEQTGAVPPPQRPILRQKVRLIELQRFALHRGLPLNKKPKFFPVDANAADATILALLEMGADPAPYMQVLFEAVWGNELNIADEDTLVSLLDQKGHDGKAIVAASRDPKFTALRQANAREALADNVPGAPAYVLNGECFWGQDRLDLLDEALTSGREPITP